MKFYTVAEIAELLRLSQSQVYGLIEEGKLRAHRFTRRRNGAIRISQAQLDDYLASCETVPPVEPEPVRRPPSPAAFSHLPPA